VNIFRFFLAAIRHSASCYGSRSLRPRSPRLNRMRCGMTDSPLRSWRQPQQRPERQRSTVIYCPPACMIEALFPVRYRYSSCAAAVPACASCRKGSKITCHVLGRSPTLRRSRAHEIGLWFHRMKGAPADVRPGPFVPPPDPRAETQALRAAQRPQEGA
jgi:hypothetical protein